MISTNGYFTDKIIALCEKYPDLGIRISVEMVAIELMRKGEEFYCYRTKDGKEVDFAVREGLKVSRLIQACYDTGNDKTKKREVNAILKAGQEIWCDSLVVMTWDYEARERFNGSEIHYLPLWKWLIDYARL